MPSRLSFGLPLGLLGLVLLFGGDALPTLAGDDSTQQLALAGLRLELGLLSLAFAGATLGPGTIRARLGLDKSRVARSELAILAAGTVAVSYAIYGVIELAELAENSSLSVLESELSGIGGSTLLLVTLSFALAAPLAEELLCRGLAQRGLVWRLGPAAGIALAGALFGTLHVDPVHAVSAGVLGLYLGAIAYLADSTRASIVCHLINNLLAVLSAAWGIGVGPARPLGIGLGLLLAALALGFVWRRAGAPPRLPGSFPNALPRDERATETGTFESD